MMAADWSALMSRSLKPNPHTATNRLAAVEEVGWAVGQVKIRGQMRPILLDGLQCRVAVHAGNVVHDEDATSVRFGAGARVAKNGIEIPV
jgi:hypothetical protein